MDVMNFQYEQNYDFVLSIFVYDQIKFILFLASV